MITIHGTSILASVNKWINKGTEGEIYLRLKVREWRFIITWIYRFVKLKKKVEMNMDNDIRHIIIIWTGAALSGFDLIAL